MLLDGSKNAADFFLRGSDLRGLAENLDIADGVKEEKRIALPSLFNPAGYSGSQKKNEETESLSSQ